MPENDESLGLSPVLKVLYPEWTLDDALDRIGDLAHQVTILKSTIRRLWLVLGLSGLMIAFLLARMVELAP